MIKTNAFLLQVWSQMGANAGGDGNVGIVWLFIPFFLEREDFRLFYGKFEKDTRID